MQKAFANKSRSLQENRSTSLHRQNTNEGMRTNSITNTWSSYQLQLSKTAFKLKSKCFAHLFLAFHYCHFQLKPYMHTYLFVIASSAKHKVQE